MKNGLYILLILLFTSCSPRNYSGLYGECDRVYLACSQILLEENGEFSYYEYWDVGGVHNIVKGKWKLEMDTLILNSYAQPEDIIDTVIEKTVDTLDSIIFKFYNVVSKVPEFGAVNLNDSMKCVTDINGTCQINGGISITTIMLKLLSLREVKIAYSPINGNANYFEFYLNDPKVNFYFINEKWLIKGEKMYLFPEEDMKVFKRKTAIKNKVF